MTPLQTGDVVIRAYAHNPEEWGIVLDFETVIIDPRNSTTDIENEDALEYVYVTVLWPGYTTQEADYELWTPREAVEYAVKHCEKQSKK